MHIPTYFHVDVFASRPMSGNGLIVFLDADAYSTHFMQMLTQEMRQFESIFLSQVTSTSAQARVFTVEEELPFAGHPVLGAAAVLHQTLIPTSKDGAWIFKLASGNLSVSTKQMGGYFRSEMNQGSAKFEKILSQTELVKFLVRLNLRSEDLVSGLPAQVVSTGLPYLVLPIVPEALGRIKYIASDVEAQLATIGAKFIFALDVTNFELRSWDNLGRIEDVATGSAAGPAAAYLIKHGLADPNREIEISQGGFVNRPSKILVRLARFNELLVSGDIYLVSSGVLDAGLFGKKTAACAV